MRHSISVAALVAALGAPWLAQADELEEGGQLYAIQNRKHLVSHEFAIGVGTVPLDAFYKGVTFAGSYTFHFDDELAWEILGGAYSLNVKTSLREDLEQNFGVQPTEFPELRLLFNSNFVWKPLYGKMVFRNSSLLYAELFLTAGPAVASYVNVENLFIGLNAGLGARLYLSRAFAIRADVRWYEIVNTGDFGDFRGELLLQLGIGLNIQ